MKQNIKMNDARFVINPEKRKVVCIIDKTRFLFTDFMRNNLRINVNGLWGEKLLLSKLYMPNRFVGVATCAESDEWNEDTGKMIAFSRAKDNLNKSFFKRANLYVNTLDDWLTDAMECINKYGEKVTSNTERRHNKIEDIIGEE